MAGSVCTARNLGHYVVDKCAADGRPVSNLQLQKILYFLQSVYCRVTGALLFNDEFEAWPYGPVVSDVYREFSKNGGNVIEERFSAEIEFDEWTKHFIDDGIEVLRDKSPWDLVQTSHAKGSPWDIVYNERGAHKGRIPNDLIVEASRR